MKGKVWMTTVAAALVCAAAWGAEQAAVWLDDLDLRTMSQSFGEPAKKKSIEGTPLKVGSRAFERGVGTHAESSFQLALKPGVQRLLGSVGICDTAKGNGSVEFFVFGDGKQLWSSGVLRGKDVAKPMDVDLRTVRVVTLKVMDGGDGVAYDHAAWLDARITLAAGAASDVVAVFVPPPPEILTPPAPPSPRINGARVLGVRPGSPVLFTIPATGDRPMAFSAQGLPAGLQLDAEKGRITGLLRATGEYHVVLHAKNANGVAQRPFRIVVGDRIALTPPMGWNSWNCWGCDASDERVRTIARAFVDSGLINHGWTYVNLDDGWQSREEHDTGGPGRFPPSFALQADKKKFPDIAKLFADIHEMGLKVGLYSTPWKFSYGNYTGGSADDAQGHRDNAKVVGSVTFEAQDAKEWASWGVDYLKYDWGPIDVGNTKRMSLALRASGRDIVFSLSNGASLQKATDWVTWSELWRTTGDINDSWSSMAGIGFSQAAWQPYSGPGHWNDPDMMVVGHVGWGNPRPCRLTADEQYTHVSLWCLLSAPLLLGCDVSKLDAFTFNLLSNDEVLEVDQDPRGEAAKRLFFDAEGREVWAKTMEDGSKAIGLFNRAMSPLKVTARWADIGVTGPQRMRDLWRQKDIGTASDQFETEVAGHGVKLMRLWPAK